MKRSILYGCLLAWAIIATGCMKEHGPISPDVMENINGYYAPRLVIRGRVSDSEGKAVPAIRVDVYGVRDAQEKDIYGYNYATTDTAGQYRIVRYSGRKLPEEIIVVARDTTGRYAETSRTVSPDELKHDTISDGKGYASEIYTAVVDFVVSESGN